MELQSVIFFVFIGALCMFVVTGGYISMTSDADPSPTNLVSGAAVGGTVGAVFALLQQQQQQGHVKDLNGVDATNTNTNMATTTNAVAAATTVSDTVSATSKLFSHMRDFVSGGSVTNDTDEDVSSSLKMKVGLPTF